MLVLFHVWRPRGHSCRILVLSTHILFPFNTTWTPILERRRIFIIFTSKPLTGEVHFLFLSPDEAIQRMSQSPHRLAMVTMLEIPIEPIFIQSSTFLIFGMMQLKVCSICVFVEAGLGWITSPFHESSTIGWPHRLTILSIGVWHAKGKTLKISFTYFQHDIQIPGFNKSHLSSAMRDSCNYV